MPRKWSNLAFGKFCAFPEFIPFQMNLPSEDTLVNKAGGISFEHYADSGPAGPIGKMFVNPHFVAGKSEALDFSYNSTDLKYNFQGKLELKKSLLMEKLNIEHEVAGRPLGVLVAADFPINNPAGFEFFDVAARTAEGKLQVGARTKLNRDFSLKDPKIEFGYQLSDTLKAGVQFGPAKDLKASDVELRVAAKESGFISTGHVVLKKASFDNATVTVQAPKFNVNGKQVVVTAQAKTKGGMPVEIKSVAEVKVCAGLNLKLKASRTEKEGDRLTGSAIVTQLPGEYDLTVGATYHKSTGAIQYGALLQHGYYSFVGW